MGDMSGSVERKVPALNAACHPTTLLVPDMASLLALGMDGNQPVIASKGIMVTRQPFHS